MRRLPFFGALLLLDIIIEQVHVCATCIGFKNVQFWYVYDVGTLTVGDNKCEIKQYLLRQDGD